MKNFYRAAGRAVNFISRCMLARRIGRHVVEGRQEPRKELLLQGGEDGALRTSVMNSGVPLVDAVIFVKVLYG